MARFILCFRTVLDVPVSGAAIAALLLLGWPLQGCFTPAEDREYSVKMGENFVTLDMDMGPDGSLLLLTQVGMYYANAENPSEYERSNLHTILFRRSNGVWDTMPFKNLQRSEGSFPSFLPDREGRHRILVRDADLAKMYGLKSGRWTTQATLRRIWSFDGYGSMYGRNWNRYPHFGFKDDTTLYRVVLEENGKAMLREGRGEESSIPLGLGFNPRAFHAGTGYHVLVGIGRERDSTGMIWASGLQYFHWRDKAAEMDSVHLEDLDTVLTADPVGQEPDVSKDGVPRVPDIPKDDPEVRRSWKDEPYEIFFAPYRKGVGVYLCYAPTFCRILPLDSTGRPVTVAYAEAEYPVADIDMTSRFAPDAEGCIQGAQVVVPRDSMGRITYTNMGYPAYDSLVVWSSCRQGRDTLRIWDPPGNLPVSIVSHRFRIAPDGTPTIAALIQEAQTRPYSRFEPGIQQLPRSWIVLAEKKQGIWTTEVVATR